MLKNRLSLRCQSCGKIYEVKVSHAGGSKFCSRSCKSQASRTRPKNDPRPCVVCGVTFTPARHRGGAKFCSKSCVAKVADHSAIVAASRSTAEQRAKLLRGRGQGKTYRKLMGRHEHRVVAEQIIGRSLTFEDVVHHKDGDILNNDPFNLQVMTRAEHMREHGLAVPGKSRRKA